MPTVKKRIFNLALSAAVKIGTFNVARRFSPTVLTVLNYHRVDDASRPGFNTFIPNVSATPTEFTRQMDYVKRYYNAITCEQLNAFRRGEKELPPYPLLITFDDGYRDNYSNAYPILKERKLPALIFLATDYIENDTPFYWDHVAYCFCQTKKESVELPVLGLVSWTNVASRNAVVSRWIKSIKRLADQDKKRVVSELAGILDVEVPGGVFANLHLTWDQVREMNRNGIEMGAHTAGHPILTHIPLPKAEDELVRSKQKIEEEIGKPVVSFAYPNGGLEDFSPDVVRLVQKTGFELAFTLVNGTTRYAEIRSKPLTIRRIYLGASDVFPWFVARLSMNRFVQ
jgi:peptidoglycan/xylan/chitin deacetylase (PgdA/CDA1 family)